VLRTLIGAEVAARDASNTTNRAVAEAAGRHVGRPIAHLADRVEYARLLRGQGHSLGQITAKTGIPKSSLHRYLGGEQGTTSRRSLDPAILRSDE
jgi:hypothetical protein